MFINSPTPQNVLAAVQRPVAHSSSQSQLMFNPYNSAMQAPTLDPMAQIANSAVQHLGNLASKLVDGIFSLFGAGADACGCSSQTANPLAAENAASGAGDSLFGGILGKITDGLGLSSNGGNGFMDLVKSAGSLLLGSLGGPIGSILGGTKNPLGGIFKSVSKLF